MVAARRRSAARRASARCRDRVTITLSVFVSRRARLAAAGSPSESELPGVAIAAWSVAPEAKPAAALGAAAAFGLPGGGE